MSHNQMKKHKTENFNLPTTAASRHTSPLPGYFFSSRFICEATIHLSSRFYFEATGTDKINELIALNLEAEPDSGAARRASAPVAEDDYR